LLLAVAPACDNDAPVEPTVRLLVSGEAKLLNCTQGEPAASVGHH